MGYSILLIFEPPDAEKASKLTANMRYIANKNTDIQLRGENCLELPIDKGLSIFHQVLEISLEVPYRYAIFSEGIEWYESPKKKNHKDSMAQALEDTLVE